MRQFLVGKDFGENWRHFIFKSIKFIKLIKIDQNQVDVAWTIEVLRPELSKIPHSYNAVFRLYFATVLPFLVFSVGDPRPSQKYPILA